MTASLAQSITTNCLPVTIRKTDCHRDGQSFKKLKIILKKKFSQDLQPKFTTVVKSFQSMKFKKSKICLVFVTHRKNHEQNSQKKIKRKIKKSNTAFIVATMPRKFFEIKTIYTLSINANSSQPRILQ